MTQALTYQLSGSIFYRLPLKDGPEHYRVSDEAALENPLLTTAALIEEGHDIHLLHCRDGSVWFGTSHLTLHVPDAAASVADFTTLWRVLARLRRLSRQAGIPRDITWVRYSNEVTDRVEPRTIHPPASVEGARTIVNKSIFATAITEAHLRAIADRSPEDEPVHEDLLLDALEALAGRNHRSAVVYAAFAAEAAAGLVLANALETAFVEQPRHVRVTRRALSGDQERLTEPIYEMLSRTDGFRYLLHERPLYLLRRSLLVEDEPLYQALVKLYRTRNSVVHSSTRKTDIFDLDEPAAAACISNVIRLLEWLGLAHDFVVPGGMLDLETGRDAQF
ncbi:MAG TPA: hypothetical protein VGG74_28660 [Kofleriaceae bacterium]|jgi:hypothetical protein